MLNRERKVYSLGNQVHIKMMIREYMVSIFAVLLIFFLPFQAKSQNQSQDKNTTISDPDSMSVYVHVIDKKTGQFIEGLNREEFSLYDGGVKQEIHGFNQDEGAVSAIVLLDMSGSMRYSSKLIKEVLTDFFKALAFEDEVALMVFADTSKLVLPFTKDKNVLTKTMADLETEKAYGRTHERQGLNSAIRQSLSASNPPHRRIIIMITDSLLNWHEEQHSQEDIRKELAKAGVTLHGLIVPSHEPRFIDQLPKSAKQDLSIYVRETGGRLLDLRDEQARPKIRKTIDNSHKHYTFKYLPNNRSKDRSHPRIKLKISPEVEKRVGKVELSFKISQQ